MFLSNIVEGGHGFFLVSLERAIYKKIGKHCRRPFKIIIVKDIKSLKLFFLLQCPLEN